MFSKTVDVVRKHASIDDADEAFDFQGDGGSWEGADVRLPPMERCS